MILPTELDTCSGFNLLVLLVLEMLVAAAAGRGVPRRPPPGPNSMAAPVCQWTAGPDCHPAAAPRPHWATATVISLTRDPAAAGISDQTGPPGMPAQTLTMIWNPGPRPGQIVS
jgi:hypothetical protein